jgi:hypothetical protein
MRNVGAGLPWIGSLLAGAGAMASPSTCPDLSGRFLCPSYTGSGPGFELRVSQTGDDQEVAYTFSTFFAGRPDYGPSTSRASPEGVLNPEGTLIARCETLQGRPAFHHFQPGALPPNTTNGAESKRFASGSEIFAPDRA